MDLKGLKDKVKGYVKKTVLIGTMGAVGATIFTNVALGAPNPQEAYHRVVVKDPECARMLAETDEIAALEQIYKDAVKRKEYDKALEAKQSIDNVKRELFENGKYNAIEIGVSKTGHCEIIKWQPVHSKGKDAPVATADLYKSSLHDNLVYYKAATLDKGSLKIKEWIKKNYSVKTTYVKSTLKSKMENQQAKTRDSLQKTKHLRL